MVDSPFFRYHRGNSLLHRIPAYIKLALLPPLSIVVFVLPIEVGIAILAIELVAMLLVGIRIGEILSDITPVIVYALCVYISGFMGLLLSYITQGGLAVIVPSLYKAFNGSVLNIKVLVSWSRILPLSLGGSIIFRTTTALEIRRGVEILFSKIGGKTLSCLLSLFLLLIPEVFRIYSQCRAAYYVRRRRRGVLWTIAIIPVLISSTLDRAWRLSRSIQMRDTLAGH